MELVLIFAMSFDRCSMPYLDPVPCGADEYQCFNWQCIRASFYCDGDDDCGDRSDEPFWCGQSLSLDLFSVCLLFNLQEALSNLKTSIVFFLFLC